MNIFEYFTDPILRAPTLGCMLMCLAASLMGVILFLQKRSLLSEALSHTAYPGVVVGIGFFTLLGFEEERVLIFFVLLFALVFSFFGLKSIDKIIKKNKVSPDAALCFVLASFFGLGILAFSFLQDISPLFAKQAQTYLYGQVATMLDEHILIYGILAFAVVGFLVLYYRPLHALLFDQEFAACLGILPKSLSSILMVLLVLATVIGIRSVGVILMAGMLIAPAVAARQWTNHLSKLFFLAGLFGTLSGCLGNICSVEGTIALQERFPEARLSLPTGPMIVLVGTMIALFSLLFAPRRGAVSCFLRAAVFRKRCIEENVLKGLWKNRTSTFLHLKELHSYSSPRLRLLLWRMKRQGWILQEKEQIQLTLDGNKKASRIVRLHRLWEAYLSELGWSEDSVHHPAEEMEHILTFELEEKLAKVLGHPKHDPHAQPIPENLP